MNRRSFLIALAIALPLAIFGAAKFAARWRPVKLMTVGSLPMRNPMMGGAEVSLVMRASERAILLPTAGESRFLDLQTGEVRELQKEGIIVGGQGEWKFADGPRPQLIVRPDDGAERPYDLPPASVAEFGRLPASFFASPLIVVNEARVEMAIGRRYFRWNANSRALERDVNCVVPVGSSNSAIARDGETIRKAVRGEIDVFSTQTGAFVRADKLSKPYNSASVVSSYGGFALYSFPMANATSQYIVIGSNARELWKFVTDRAKDTVVLSPDEKYLAIGRGDRKLWEIRDLQTGKILRTIALVPDTNTAAFSPDGDTLYSIAGGVLYRQRAR